MSVEKIISRESIPFAQISNNVIAYCKNPAAFQVWAYLLSKPADWKVVKQHVKKHFGIGDDKLKYIFSYLVRCGLAKNIYHKDENTNRYLSHEIMILNGSQFNPNEPYKISNKKLSTYDNELIMSTGVKSPLVDDMHKENINILNNMENNNLDSTGVKSPPAGNRALQIKKETNKERSKKHICASEQKYPLLHFDELWSNYLKKRGEEAAKKIYIKHKLHTIGKYIIEKVKKFNEIEYKFTDKQFIPDLRKFLEQKIYDEDPISKISNNFKYGKPEGKKESIIDRLNRITSGNDIKGNVIDGVLASKQLGEFKE